MCIAIFRPSGVKICKRVLQHCFAQNPHGAGFAIPENNRVVIQKGLFSFREFWEYYRSCSPDSPMLIHFRVATSGNINGDNCHPWRIDEQHALVHNGVLEHKLDLCHDDVSDTGLFVHNILTPTIAKAPNIWLNSGFKWALEESVGSSNKVVILDAAGNHQIFNEEKGEWSNGAWFSNATFKEERKKKPGTSVVSQRSNTFRSKRTDFVAPPSVNEDIVNQEPPPHFFIEKKEEKPENVSTANVTVTADMTDPTLYC
jgi:hypothetical protein